MVYQKRIIQFIVIILVNALTLIMIAMWLPDIKIESFPAAIGVCIAFIAAELVYWGVFIIGLSSLPVWLYPLFTIFMASGIFIFLCKLIPGVNISSLQSGLWISAILATVNAFSASLLSLDIEGSFDRNVTQKIVERVGKTTDKSSPGFLFLEIDGLSEKIFRRALRDNYMPSLKRWLQNGSHHILSWETGFRSQTCSMQTGILIGNNDDTPAFRWWDRKKRRVIVSGYPWDAAEIEARLSSGKGLLSGGGASRGNMFSGDAREAMFTVSTMFDTNRQKGPGFYMYLTSIYITARLTVRFLGGVLKEWGQSILQRLRCDRYTVSSRNLFYGFLRATIGPLLQEITTTLVIGDAMRGLPAIYAVYAEYDDLAHFAGMDSAEAFDVLSDIDRYIGRIERAVKRAPRDYHIVILSDHGQSNGHPFHAVYGLSLEQLVKRSLRDDNEISSSTHTSESRHQLDHILNESVQADSKSAHSFNNSPQGQGQNAPQVSPGRQHLPAHRRSSPAFDKNRLVVLASGCTGMIYFTEAGQRLSFENIQTNIPELIPSLVQHPGIGFVLVRSEKFGDLVLGRNGIHYLDQDRIEGCDPLEVYPSGAARSLKEVSSFSSCADILVNTRYNPQTEELCSFENQVSHHGGLGGPQNHPFIFYPAVLPISQKPLIGAPAVYRLLKGWRDTFQQSTSPLVGEAFLQNGVRPN